MNRRIEGFIWPDWVLDKITVKHGVEPDEVEAVFFNVPAIVRKASTGKYLLYGQSDNGRYVLVVFVWVGREVKIITARDMTQSERQYLRGK